MIKQFVVFGVLIAGVLIAVKIRTDASRQRKAVLSRLEGELPQHGELSPVEMLFREAGVPAPPTVSDLATAPPPPPHPPAPPSHTDASAPSHTDASAPSHTDGSSGPLPDPSASAAVPGPDATWHASSTPTAVLNAPNDAATAIVAALDLPASFMAVPASADLASVSPGDVVFHDPRDADDVRADLSVRFARPGCTTTWIARNEVRVSQDGRPALVSLRDASDSPELGATGCIVRISPA